MNACGVEGTNQGLVTTYKTFTSKYINVSRSRNRMKFIIALTKTVLFQQ